MPYRLLKFGLRKEHREPRFFTTPDKLKSHYDVVILGGGGHGLLIGRDPSFKNYLCDTLNQVRDDINAQQISGEQS